MDATCLTRMLGEKFLALEQTGSVLQARLYYENRNLPSNSILQNTKYENLRKNAKKNFPLMDFKRKNWSNEDSVMIRSELGSITDAFIDVLKFKQSAVSVLTQILHTPHMLLESNIQILKLLTTLTQICIQLEDFQFRKEILCLYYLACKLDSIEMVLYPMLCKLFQGLELGAIKMLSEEIGKVSSGISGLLMGYEATYKLQLGSVLGRGIYSELNPESIFPFHEIREWVIFSCLLFPHIFIEKPSLTSLLVQVVSETYCVPVFRDTSLVVYDALMKSLKRCSDSANIKIAVTEASCISLLNQQVGFDNLIPVLRKLCVLLRADPGAVGPLSCVVFQCLNISKRQLEQYFRCFPCGFECSPPKVPKSKYSPASFMDSNVNQVMALHLDLAELVHEYNEVIVYYYKDYLKESDLCFLDSLIGEESIGEESCSLTDELKRIRDLLAQDNYGSNVFHNLITSSTILKLKVLNAAESDWMLDALKCLGGIILHAKFHWDLADMSHNYLSLENLLFHSNALTWNLNLLLQEGGRRAVNCEAYIRVLKDRKANPLVPPEESQRLFNDATGQLEIRLRIILKKIPELMDMYFESQYNMLIEPLLGRHIGKAVKRSRKAGLSIGQESLYSDLKNTNAINQTRNNLIWICMALQTLEYNRGFDERVSSEIKKWFQMKIRINVQISNKHGGMSCQPSKCMSMVSLATSIAVMVGELVNSDQVPIIRQVLHEESCGSNRTLVSSIAITPKAGLLAASSAHQKSAIHSSVQQTCQPTFVESVAAWLIHFFEKMLASQYDGAALVYTNSMSQELKNQTIYCTDAFTDGILIRSQESTTWNLEQTYNGGLGMPGIVFSDASQSYVRVNDLSGKLKSNRTSGKNVIFDPELWLNVHETSCIVQLAGPQGMQIIDRYILAVIATKALRIQCLLQENRGKLETIKLLLRQSWELFHTEPNEGKRPMEFSELLSKSKQLVSMDELVAAMVTIGHGLKIRSMLKKALRNSLSQYAPDMHFCVEQVSTTLPHKAQQCSATCGFENDLSDHNFRQVLLPIVTTRDQANLWKLLPIAVSASMTHKAWRSSNFIPSLDAHANNIHVVPSSVLGLLSSIFPIISSMSVEGDAVVSWIDQLRHSMLLQIRSSCTFIAEMNQYTQFREWSFRGLNKYVDKLVALTQPIIHSRDLEAIVPMRFLQVKK